MNNLAYNDNAIKEFKDDLLKFEKDLITNNNSQTDSGVVVTKLAKKLEDLEKKYENQ